jgi:hypothetical protein
LVLYRNHPSLVHSDFCVVLQPSREVTLAAARAAAKVTNSTTGGGGGGSAGPVFGGEGGGGGGAVGEEEDGGRSLDLGCVVGSVQTLLSGVHNSATTSFFFTPE